MRDRSILVRPLSLTLALAYYAAVVAGLATMLVDGGWIVLATYYLGMPVGATVVWLAATRRWPTVARRPVREIARDLMFGAASAGTAVGALIAVIALAGWLTIEQFPALSALAGLALHQVVVASVEEYTFRGVLQRVLSARLGQLWGLALAAALFGLFHLPNIGHQGVPLAHIPATLLNLTLMGLVFGWAFRRAGYHLALPLALHFGWNVISYSLEDATTFTFHGPRWLVGSTTWFPESGLLGGLALLALAGWLARGIVPHRPWPGRI